MNYYIIIPAHNEETFLGITLNSIKSQTLQPKKVIIVNDNSTDKTEDIIDTYILHNPIYSKLNTISSKDHMPGSKVINAFTKGLELLDTNYDFLVKLDADVILPNNYFEQIATILKKHSNAGIVGGFVYEKNSEGEWKLNHPMNKNHVRGAFKAYSKKCFKAIGGLKNAMGWDTVDAYNKKAKLLQGKAMYTMRYGFIITLIASLKMAWKQNKPQAFFDNIKGFFKASNEKAPFLVTVKEGKFIRRLRWNGIKKQLF